MSSLPSISISFIFDTFTLTKQLNNYMTDSGWMLSPVWGTINFSTSKKFKSSILHSEEYERDRLEDVKNDNTKIFGPRSNVLNINVKPRLSLDVKI